jgi:hypothetical protein
MHGDEHPMRTTTHPESIPPSPARAILYSLSSKRDSPATMVTTNIVDFARRDEVTDALTDLLARWHYSHSNTYTPEDGWLKSLLG